MKNHLLRTAHIVLLLFLASLLFGTGQIGAEEKAEEKKEDVKQYLLRYHFQKDQVLRWNVLQSLNISTAVRGQREDVESTSRSTKVWKVVKLENDGTATFEYRVEDVDMHHSQTGRDTAKFNSRKDKTVPPNFSNLDGKINVPLAHLAIDPQGKTKYKTLLREYSAKDLENRIVIPLPNQRVAVGDSWSVNDPTEIEGSGGMYTKINVKQQYTLKSVEAGLARIECRSIVLTPVEPTTQAKILDKYYEGYYQFDMDAGHIVSQELRIDKRVIGFQGNSSSIRHQFRLKECCCGLKSCELCVRRNDIL